VNERFVFHLLTGQNKVGTTGFGNHVLGDLEGKTPVFDTFGKTKTNHRNQAAGRKKTTHKTSMKRLFKMTTVRFDVFIFFGVHQLLLLQVSQQMQVPNIIRDCICGLSFNARWNCL